MLGWKLSAQPIFVLIRTCWAEMEYSTHLPVCIVYIWSVNGVLNLSMHTFHYFRTCYAGTEGSTSLCIF
jgi:hypothetical protein